MNQDFLYKKILIDYLQEKQLKNPAYSIGSLGKLLNIPTSRMGEILRGKIGISVSRAYEISKKLKLEEEVREKFILSVKTEHARSPIEKEYSRVLLNNSIRQNEKLTSELVCNLSPLEHSIYNYFQLKSSPLCELSIVKFYCLDEATVKSSLHTLVELNLIRLINDYYVLSSFTQQRTGGALLDSTTR